MSKKIGIIERLKAVNTVKEINKLAKEGETYSEISNKTSRRFTKISKRKIAEIKKKS